MKQQLKYKTQAAIPNAACFRNCVNTLIPTLFQFTFTFWGPTTQLPEADVSWAIRLKKIISSILVLISVIHGKK